MTDEPECMTCNGATTYDLATRQLFFGSIPLCFLHAELMRETIADAEWREGSGAMTDEQKQEAEPTIEMFVDWDEAYPVYYMSESDDTDGRVALRFTAAEIEFIDKAEADYTTAQNLIEKRLGYRP